MLAIFSTSAGKYAFEQKFNESHWHNVYISQKWIVLSQGWLKMCLIYLGTRIKVGSGSGGWKLWIRIRDTAKYGPGYQTNYTEIRRAGKLMCSPNCSGHVASSLHQDLRASTWLQLEIVDATHFTRPTEVPLLFFRDNWITQAYIIRGENYDTGNNKYAKDHGLKRNEKVKNLR